MIYYAGNETPKGDLDGVNCTFTLANTIVNADSIVITKNGVTQTKGEDYYITGAANQIIVFAVAPESTDLLQAYYEYSTSLITGGYEFVVPTGNIDGSNETYLIPSEPKPTSSLRMFYNGVLLYPSQDWNFSNSSNTTILLNFPPEGDDTLLSMYRSDSSYTAGPCYHDPVITNANSIIYATGDQIAFQVNAIDFEDNTLIYALSNTDSIPGNISISSTGLISGTVDRAELGMQSFEVHVAKEVSTSYNTTANFYLDVVSSAIDSIQWSSSSNIGTVVASRPSTLCVEANIVSTFGNSSTLPATANCTLKVIGAEIIDGGSNFNVGSYKVISGGACVGNANIAISSVDSSGAITGITVANNTQQYSILPDSLLVLWENPDTDSKNSLLKLNFGVDEVTIINAGEYYDNALVGFGNSGQTVDPVAVPFIHEGRISNISVISPGEFFPHFPSVEITSKDKPRATNPIVYTLSSGSLPDGLKLLENGEIVGVPVPAGNVSYSFTVLATCSYANEVVTSTKDFTLALSSATEEPLTNLSLEVFIDSDNWKYFKKALHNNAFFSEDAIYRPTDFYFGIPKDLRLLVAYGIYPTTSEQIANALSYAHHPKKLLLNGLKWAKSSSENYEVVYIEPLDMFTTTDYTSLNDSSDQPSFDNMTTQLLKTVSDFNTSALPSWMTDTQPDGTIIGYIPAIPIGYFKPGYGKMAQYFIGKYFEDTMPLNQIEAYSDRYIWNKGVCKDWNRGVSTKLQTTLKSPLSGSGNVFITTTNPSTTYANGLPINLANAVVTQLTINSDYTTSNMANIVNSLDIEELYATQSGTTLNLINTSGGGISVSDPSNSAFTNTNVSISVISSGWNSNSSNVFLNKDEYSEYFSFPDEHRDYGMLSDYGETNE